MGARLGVGEQGAGLGQGEWGADWGTGGGARLEAGGVWHETAFTSHRSGIFHSLILFLYYLT